MTAFHDIRFPTDVALGARGGPERRTEIVTLGSGFERRNARWAHARRRWDAGYGITSLEKLTAVVAFFEERRGRLHAFCWRDRLDFTSSAPGVSVSATDQQIGTGDGETRTFALTKTYGAGEDPYVRPITKPVVASVRVAIDGAEQAAGADFTVDALAGAVVFSPGNAPADGAVVTAGFEFDVPVRFDTDSLDIDLAAFKAGVIPSIPVVEVRV